jgi:hypothetical protein
VPLEKSSSQMREVRFSRWDHVRVIVHVVVTESGDEYDSLFGALLPIHNPAWR